MVDPNTVFHEHALQILDHFSRFSEWGAPKIPTQFKLYLEIGSDLSASCDSRIVNGTEIFSITIGPATPFYLSEDLDLTSKEDLRQFSLRVAWVIAHEIGHWAWGHNHFYTQYGWATSLGLSETATADQPLVGPLSLAHSAELIADTFAVQLVLEYLAVQYGNTVGRSIGVPETVEEIEAYNHQILIDVHDAYLAIVTSAAIFYRSRLDRQASQLHPSWAVRTLNINHQIFELFLQDRVQYHRAKNRLSLEAGDIVPKDVFETTLLQFVERVAAPALIKASETSDVLEFPDWFFPYDRPGIVDLGSIISIMTGNNDKQDSDIERLFRLREQSRILVDYCELKSPAKDVKPNRAFGGRNVTNSIELDIRVMTQFDREESEARIQAWSATHNIEVKDIHFVKSTGMDELQYFVDIVVKAADHISPDQLKATLDYLHADLKISAKKSSEEE